MLFSLVILSSRRLLIHFLSCTYAVLKLYASRAHFNNEVGIRNCLRLGAVERVASSARARAIRLSRVASSSDTSTIRHSFCQRTERLQVKWPPPPTHDQRTLQSSRGALVLSTNGEHEITRESIWVRRQTTQEKPQPAPRNAVRARAPNSGTVFTQKNESVSDRIKKTKQ